jgi:hypothetical protein
MEPTQQQFPSDVAESIMSFQRETLAHVQQLTAQITNLAEENKQHRLETEKLRATVQNLRLKQSEEESEPEIESEPVRKPNALCIGTCVRMKDLLHRQLTKRETERIYTLVVERQQKNVLDFLGAFRTFNQMGMIRKWREKVNGKPQIAKAKRYRELESLPRRVQDPKTGKFRHLHVNESGGELYPLNTPVKDLAEFNVSNTLLLDMIYWLCVITAG